MLRITAVAMILFMVSQGFYPHDRVLESQAWKKAVYAGGTYVSKVEMSLHQSRQTGIANMSFCKKKITILSLQKILKMI